MTALKTSGIAEHVQQRRVILLQRAATASRHARSRGARVGRCVRRAASRRARRQALLARDDRCIRCGACVVQCSQDALALEDERGRRLEPDTIRRFKLTLLGQRTVDAGGGTSDQRLR